MSGWLGDNRLGSHCRWQQEGRKIRHWSEKGRKKKLGASVISAAKGSQAVICCVGQCNAVSCKAPPSACPISASVNLPIYFIARSQPRRRCPVLAGGVSYRTNVKKDLADHFFPPLDVLYYTTAVVTQCLSWCENVDTYRVPSVVSLFTRKIPFVVE